VIATGGIAAGTATNTVDSFDPSLNTWQALAPMSASRYAHAAVLAGDGRVLVSGGGGATTEFFNPAGGFWTAGPTMQFARSQQTATRLADDRVLIAGGSGAVSTSETWTYPMTGCTVINSLPMTISASGTYCMTSSLGANLSSGNAITINADNVTVDLGGFIIDDVAAGSGNQASGIGSNGHRHIVVRNGSVNGFYNGVVLSYSGSASNLVEDVTVNFGLEEGIEVDGDLSEIRTSKVLTLGGSTVTPATAIGIAMAANKGRIIGNTISNVLATGGSVPGVDETVAIDVSGNTVRVVANTIVNVHGSPVFNQGIACNTSGQIGIEANSVNVSTPPGRAWLPGACVDLGGNTWTGVPPQ